MIFIFIVVIFGMVVIVVIAVAIEGLAAMAHQRLEEIGVLVAAVTPAILIGVRVVVFVVTVAATLAMAVTAAMASAAVAIMIPVIIASVVIVMVIIFADSPVAFFKACEMVIGFIATAGGDCGFDDHIRRLYIGVVGKDLLFGRGVIILKGLQIRRAAHGIVIVHRAVAVEIDVECDARGISRNIREARAARAAAVAAMRTGIAVFIIGTAIAARKASVMPTMMTAMMTGTMIVLLTTAVARHMTARSTMRPAAMTKTAKLAQMMTKLAQIKRPALTARVRRAIVRPLRERVGHFAKPEFSKAHFNTHGLECPHKWGYCLSHGFATILP